MKFLDLFSGIGGFRLGLEQAGHECIGFCEVDEFARKSYKAIFDTEKEVEWHDITSVSNNDFRLLRGKADIICGGFPCQAFSVAGKRRGFEDTRGTLFFHIARAAKEIKPRFLFLENVKGLLSHDKGETFRIILTTLDELGYNVEWQVLNSKNFGVPQNRERVFIIGHLRGSSGRKIFPIRRTNGETNLPINIIAHRKGYRRNTQVFSPLGITEALDTGQGGGRGHYTIEQKPINTTKEGNSFAISTRTHANYDFKNVFEKKLSTLVEVRSVMAPNRTNKKMNGRRIKENEEPMFTLTTQDIHGVYLKERKENILKVKEATKKGYDEAKEGDFVNLAMPNSKTRRGRIGKGIANTIDTTGQQGVVDNYRIRKLTPKECWRLQGFPDWTFERAKRVNSDSQLYKQAGNSVTVPVIYEIAKRFE